MKMKSFLLLLMAFFIGLPVFSQQNKEADLLKIILSKYYKNEKVVVKNRLQLLSLYCKKAPNNEEVNEVIQKNAILKKYAAEIQKQIDITLDEDWSAAYNAVFDNQNQYLKTKVNNCLSHEEFQKVSKRFNDNNQRLMIISKPIFFDKNKALVKVVFYRNIEHNNGGYLLFENTNNVWTLKEILNEWAT